MGLGRNLKTGLQIGDARNLPHATAKEARKTTTSFFLLAETALMVCPSSSSGLSSRSLGSHGVGSRWLDNGRFVHKIRRKDDSEA
ncbi:hypothetical protein CRG98_017106 [Punica granatum]|uniref:Uncharacterized protein n=1 Tax=Punica granatum TaxID=22663 RepID=A0A2I0K1Q3_PUNGR|nr:hypothetical protein CRG98_017106 [Punica granatum]